MREEQLGQKIAWIDDDGDDDDGIGIDGDDDGIGVDGDDDGIGVDGDDDGIGVDGNGDGIGVDGEWCKGHLICINIPPRNWDEHYYHANFSRMGGKLCLLVRVRTLSLLP